MKLGRRDVGRRRGGTGIRRRRALAPVVGAVAALSVTVAAGGAAHGAAGTPNDPLYPHQWNLVKVGAPAAWTRSTGQGVLIGIVDTGVDLRQEDLAGKVLASTDCVGANGDPAACSGSGQDDNGHGTHVAGIAAADTDNAKGVAGMAPNAHLVVAKVLDGQGNGSIADVNAGIEWVVQHGARVVNLSLGSDLPALTGLLGNNSLAPGVDYAWNHGAIPVLAAGNENFFGLGSANYGNANAVIVGATGPNDEVAPYSSPLGNAKWAVVAPGGDGQDSAGNPSCDGPASAFCIVSTWWTASNPTAAYAYDQGTSMATPMVSGALALLLAEGLSPTAAVQTLLSSADHAVSCGSGCAGRIDVAKAVGTSAAVSNASVGGSPAPAGSPAPSGSAAPPGGSPGSPGGAGQGPGAFRPGSSPELGGLSPGSAPSLPPPGAPGLPASGAGSAPQTTSTLGPTLSGGRAQAEGARTSHGQPSSDGAAAAGAVAAGLLVLVAGLSWWLRVRGAGAPDPAADPTRPAG